MKVIVNLGLNFTQEQIDHFNNMVARKPSLILGSMNYKCELEFYENPQETSIIKPNGEICDNLKPFVEPIPLMPLPKKKNKFWQLFKHKK